MAFICPAASGGVAEFYPAVAKNPDTYNKQFKVFWMGVGKDDGLTGPGDHAFAEALKKHGVKQTVVVSPGRHEWTVWRHHLAQVAPLLFQ